MEVNKQTVVTKLAECKEMFLKLNQKLDQLNNQINQLEQDNKTDKETKKNRFDLKSQIDDLTRRILVFSSCVDQIENGEYKYLPIMK